MNPRVPASRPALRGVLRRRLAMLLVGAVAAGLATDWLRGEGRLVFPRPLPPFTTTPSPP